MRNIRSNIIFVFCLIYGLSLQAQRIGGQFGSQSIFYNEDNAASAVFPDTRFGSNTFLQLRYDKEALSAGIRLENYSPVLQGFDPRYDGFGVTNKFVSYSEANFSISVGDLYEQFGEGLTLRTYWDWNLGFDNSIQGFSVRANPLPYLEVKGIVGKQRNYFSLGEGTIRGFDGQIDLRQLKNDTLPSKFYSFIVGGNIVSKFQEDNNPLIKLPENVAAFSGRLNFVTKKLNFNSEFAFKINDPSFVNNQIYKSGNAQYLNLSYALKGLGINLNYKRVDNFDFRSDRSAAANDLFINYLPAVTQNQTYTMFNLYPYFTQTMGEQGLDFNMDYKLMKGTKLGGKTGANLHLNISSVFGLKTIPTNNYLGYRAEGLALGTSYYQFAQLELRKKLNSSWSTIWNYSYFEANNDALRLSETKGIISGHIFVLEAQFKANADHGFRSEIQSLFSQQDRGSWVSFLLEYTYKRRFGISILDNYNYKTYNGSKALHYPSINLFYKKSALLASLGYGRQNAGALCVGGVCRFVPAYSGANVSINYSF